MPAQAAIYLPLADPDLARVFPKARSDKGLFRKATYFELDLGGDKVRLGLMPRADIPRHLQGFRGYVATLPGSAAARAAATERLLRTQSVLGLRTTAEFEHNAAIRPALLAIAGAFGGFVFVDDGIVLADGTELIGPLGSGDEDDDEDEDVDEAPVPPTPLRVAQRALVLCAVSCRGFIEDGAGDEGAEGLAVRLLPWLREQGLAGELEPHEADLLATKLGALDPQARTNATWRSEGLAVLAWALGRHGLPAYDEQVDPREVAESLGFLEDGAGALLAAPRLRPQAELDAYRHAVFSLHWRLRQFGIDGKAMDFAEFAGRAWFGPMSLEGLRLIERDLAIGAVPIARAGRDDYRRCASTAQERHQAANWLHGYGAVYSDVDTST